MPKTSVSISFGLVDVTAKSDTTASASEHQPFSDPRDLSLEGVYPAAAATLEKDYWKLDGTFVPFPDKPENTSWGLWSYQMSGENRKFSSPIVLTLTFQNLHESRGLTFEFNPYGNDYCNDLNIKWYKGSTLIADKSFAPDNWRYSCMNKVVNYNKIVVTFYGMNKMYRYLKLQNIQHGVTKSFDNSELENTKVLEEVNLMSTELSINTLDFTVHCKDDEFNIFNPQGVYDLLQKKQQLSVEGTKDGKLMNMGYFYVDEWENDNGIADISAQDAIGIMDGTMFNGGMYKNIDAKDLIDEVMKDAGFGYSLSSSLADVKVSGYLARSSHREALQQIAFAIGAYVDTSRGGMVKICAQPENVPAVALGMNRRITGEKVSLRSYVSGVSVTEHTYAVEDEISELYKGELEAGENLITFSNPATSITCSGAAIKESGVNYCIVNVTSAGEVIINGKKYADSQSVVTVKTDDIEAGEKENIEEVTGATLVGKHNSLEVANRLLNYYQNRIQQNMSFILDTETAGETVSVEVSEGVFRNTVIESLETDLTGGFITTAVTAGA